MVTAFASPQEGTRISSRKKATTLRAAWCTSAGVSLWKTPGYLCPRGPFSFTWEHLFAGYVLEGLPGSATASTWSVSGAHCPCAPGFRAPCVCCLHVPLPAPRFLFDTPLSRMASESQGSSPVHAVSFLGTSRGLGAGRGLTPLEGGGVAWPGDSGVVGPGPTSPGPPCLGGGRLVTHSGFRRPAAAYRPPSVSPGFHGAPTRTGELPGC